jgi:hypothetical protein
MTLSAPMEPLENCQMVTNKGIEFFKVKSPDMIGDAQWTVLRDGRSTKVYIKHRSWLEAYHRRDFAILPGDSLKCSYEESICYDAYGNEIERKLYIAEVQEIIKPLAQMSLLN